MEQQDFGKYIQKANIRQIIIPVAFVVFLFVVFWSFSVKNWLFPVRITDEGEIDAAYEGDSTYVYCNVKRLLYTGIDHYARGKVDGYYYYSLVDGTCRYYLIDARQKQAQPVLENYGFGARILREEELASNLDKLMAGMLDWTMEGVDRVAGDYILSEIDYDRKNILLIAALMLLSGTLAVLHIVTIVYNIFNPYAALNFSHFGNKDERRRVILEANAEYNDRVLFMSQGMYVTDNYFIYHDSDEFEIVPLEDIVWAYKHSSLKWSLGMRHFITYTIRLVTVYKKTYSFRGKTKESCDGLLEIIAGQHPEILTGYSEENKAKMAGQQEI